MNSQCRPEAKLLLRQMQRPSEQREDQEGDRIQDENCAQRNSDLFVAGLNDGGDGGNRAAATNGGAGGDQDRCGLIHAQKFSKEKSENQGKGNARSGVYEAAATGA